VNNFLLLSILILLNIIIAYRVSDFNLLDYSSSQLTKESISLLRRIPPKETLKISVLVSNDANPSLIKFIKLIEKEVRNVEVEILNADLNPLLAQSFNVTKIPSTIIQYKKRSVVLYDHSELSYMNGVLKVTSETKKNIFMIKGHGEKSIDDTDSQGLSKVFEIFQNESFNAVETGISQVSSQIDDSLIVIAGPKLDLTDSEIKKLISLKSSGSSFMIFVDPVFNKNDKKNLRHFLNMWGLDLNEGYVKVKDDLAINGSNGLAPVFASPYIPFSDEKIERIFLPFSGSIKNNSSSAKAQFFLPVDGKNTEIINSSGKKVSHRQQDIFLGAYVKSNKSKLFLVANSSFLENRFVDLLNSKLFLQEIAESAFSSKVLKSLNIPNKKKSVFTNQKFKSDYLLYLFIFILNSFIVTSVHMLARKRTL
tara:strand:- start:468 stop:1736 length:1269 start_codon:yes stop_codon:yes gene_type:complete